MDVAKQKSDEEMKYRLLAFMSLEVMFPDGKTRALAAAAASGDERSIERMIHNGVDVNSVGAQGATPLFWALRNHRGFQKLLEMGANPNIVYGDGSTILTAAVNLNDSRILSLALAHGANPNLATEDSLGETPIFRALDRGVDLIDVLLSYGADINAQNHFGNTPVMTAVIVGDYDTAYYLLEKGASVKILNNNGKSLLDYASSRLSRALPQSAGAQKLNKIIEWIKKHETDEGGQKEEGRIFPFGSSS